MQTGMIDPKIELANIVKLEVKLDSYLFLFA